MRLRQNSEVYKKEMESDIVCVPWNLNRGTLIGLDFEIFASQYM